MTCTGVTVDESGDEVLHYEPTRRVMEDAYERVMRAVRWYPMAAVAVDPFIEYVPHDDMPPRPSDTPPRPSEAQDGREAVEEEGGPSVASRGPEGRMA